MHKLWLIAKHEYVKRVRKRSFLIAVLGFPLLIIAIAGISVLLIFRGGDSRPVGYVDDAGILEAQALSVLREERRRFPDFVPFAEEDDATAALEAGDIQSYYLLPEDYVTSKELVSVYSDRDPSEFVADALADYIRVSLVAGEPTQVRDRLSDGFELAVRSSDGRRRLREGNILDFLVPFVLAFFMLFAVASVGGYMLEAVTEEKENRTMEILTTSVSTTQLMGGKALGLMCVSLTQIVVWVIALAIGALVAAQQFEALRGTQIPWEMLGMTVLYFIPTFALMSGIMVSIGAMVTELQQGQQISGILNQLFIFPVYFGALFVTNPNSPFLVVLTLFPTTSLLAVLLRWSTSAIPLWQLVVSWILLAACAMTSIWLSGKVLRIGMLRYGQRLRLKDLVETLRERPAVLEQEVASHA